MREGGRHKEGEESGGSEVGHLFRAKWFDLSETIDVQLHRESEKHPRGASTKHGLGKKKSPNSTQNKPAQPNVLPNFQLWPCSGVERPKGPDHAMIHAEGAM
jgi:hypothetical protein